MVEREPLENKSGKLWRNTAGELYDPQILFFRVSDLLEYERLYREAGGKPFLPAVQQGSTAAAHLVARWEQPRTPVAKEPQTALNDREAAIVQALREHGSLKGEDLAAKAGYRYSGSLKELLSGMVRRGIIKNDRSRGGYYLP